MSTLERTPYGERSWDDPLCLEALKRCPWKDTDHDRGEGPRRENYCTWCDGYVTALINAEWKTGLGWLVREYEAALTIIKRKDIIEGVRSDWLK